MKGVPSEEMEREVLGPHSLQNYTEGVHALYRSLNNPKCFFTHSGQFALQQLLLLHTRVRRQVIEYVYNHRMKVRAGEAKPFPVGALTAW